MIFILACDSMRSVPQKSKSNKIITDALFIFGASWVAPFSMKGASTSNVFTTK
tara:strand:+ start:368 stop:526 length:159 start_codon:yes stop_codon:yes gene_type:complete